MLGPSSGSSGSSGSSIPTVFDAAGMGAYAGAVISPLLYQALTETYAELPRIESPTNGSLAAITATSDTMPKLDREVRDLLYLFEFMDGTTFVGGASGASLRRGTATVVELSKPVHADLAKEIAEMVEKAKLRRIRGPEILTQVAVPLAFYATMLNLNPERHRNVFEFMNIMFRIGKMVVMRFKLHFNEPRPADVWPALQPVVMTPGHGAYPAGHATESSMMSALLLALLKEARRLPDAEMKIIETQLDNLAKRIAENRVIAGLHYPQDNAAGEILGGGLADHIVARTRISGILSREPTDNGAGDAPCLAWLARKACEELRRL